ncbi:MAG: PQQ-binding-like beta-propeller repeat protein [Chitinophagaceae bacterium]
MKLIIRILPVLAMLIVGCSIFMNKAAKIKNQDWAFYGGNQAGDRYSDLKQVNLQNVKNLELAWTYKTGESGEMQTQPIVVNGIFYGVTATMKLFALDPATGKELWKFDPKTASKKRLQNHAIRGVTYWEEEGDKRIIYSAGTSIFAVNALTGEQIKSFGEDGEADLYAGLDKNVLGYDPHGLFYRNTSPGSVYKDLFIVGSSMSEGPDAPPGYIQAFNAKTGKLVWVFHTFPLPGEYGYETWSPDAYRKLGGANAWTGMVVDDKRGVVYASTGSSSVDFYGGARIGQNLFANCVIALDALTGKRKWHYQVVHHDLWDKDLPSPPTLMTVMHNGKMVDAVAQATKDGYIFLFDRDTGEPLFPVNEMPVPTSPSLPGEQAWRTQPVPEKPKPFTMQELNENTITDRTPEARAYTLERWKNSVTGSKYAPPTIKGSLYFGFGGGAEYGGNAADPGGILYVNGNNMLWWQVMKENPKYQTKGSALYNSNCSVCHGDGQTAVAGDGSLTVPALAGIGDRMPKDQIHLLLDNGRGRMPAFQHISKEDRESIVNYLLKTEPASAAIVTSESSNARYVPPFLSNGTQQFRDKEGYPAIKAPWGVLNAVDMNTGEYLWQVPLGEYPALTEKGIPVTGTENHGGPVVTAGGLLFIAATYDQNLRAFDTKTGKVVWQYKMPYGAVATPITYMKDGKQYIAIAAGGGKYGMTRGDTYLAFALPDKK